ncbi:major facilitator superfamily domain-containing protein [Chlamydoabsidia padenii]|nr:major facilitator superfamily domain-containing protein [Chlamydoabsidia padenii]
MKNEASSPHYASSIHSQITIGHDSNHTTLTPMEDIKKGAVEEEEIRRSSSSSLKAWLTRQNQNHRRQSSSSQLPFHSHADCKTYPMAWVALFFLVLLRAAVSIYNNTFSPIPVVTAKYLDVDLTAINWLFNVQAVVFILVSFFTSWLFESLGVKKSLIIGGGLITLGCWIRWIAVKMEPHSFSLLMVGQIIAAISSPITLNIMTKFAAVWFTEDRRATAGMFVASNYGGIIAMFLMPAVATGEKEIEFTVILVAVIATVASIPQLFLPALPPTPPSIERRTLMTNETGDPAAITEKASLWQGTLSLIKNVHFWILCGIHGINVGLSISWGGLFNQAITPYGYTNAQAGNIVAVGLVAGTLGCLIAGPILDSTKKHNLFLKLMAPLVCSTYTAMIFLIKQDSFAAILYVNGLNQFFLSFMVPIVVELGVEVTYPVPESISTSMLWQIAQVFGFILVLVMDRFRDPMGSPPNNMDRGLIFQAATSGVCVLLSFVYSGRMLRTEAYSNPSSPLEIIYDEEDPTKKKHPPTKNWRPNHLRENSSTETISVAMVIEDPKSS